MYKYYILVKGQTTGTQKYQVVEGYQLPNGFAACKEHDQTWTITDVMSGACVTRNHNILDKAKEELNRLLPQILNIRKSIKYNVAIKNMVDYINSIPENQRIEGWKRYIRNYNSTDK